MGNYKALAEREMHHALLELARDIALIQYDGGRLVVLENPWASETWSTAPLQELLTPGKFVLVRTDQCAWWKTSRLGGLVKKPTGFLVPMGHTA